MAKNASANFQMTCPVNENTIFTNINIKTYTQTNTFNLYNQ